MKNRIHPAYTPCNELGGKFSLKSHTGSWFSPEYFNTYYWSTCLPISTDLHTLSTYKHICPERQSFSHIRHTEMDYRANIMKAFQHIHDFLFKPRVTTINGMLRPIRHIYVENSIAKFSVRSALQLTHQQMDVFQYIDLTTRSTKHMKRYLLEDLENIGFKQQEAARISGKISVAPVPASDEEELREILEANKLNDVFELYMIDAEEKDNKFQYKPRFPGLVNVSSFFKELEHPPNVLVLLVDLNEDWGIHKCFDCSCLYGLHTIVVVFGEIEPTKAPTTEQLFAIYPFANYICNVTTKLDDNGRYWEIEEMEEFNEIVTKRWEKEKKKLVSHIHEIHKIQERFVEKTYKSLSK